MGARPMMRVWMLFLLAACLYGQAPRSRSEQIEQQRDLMARTPVSPDTDPVERAVIWLYDKKIIQFFTSGWNGISPTAGGMVDYAGVPLGMKYLRNDLL